MVKENGAPTAAEKGKGKMDDDKPVDTGKKSNDTKQTKDGKAVTKGEEPQDGMNFISRLMGIGSLLT